MRCLFTMFAEDAYLLQDYRQSINYFPDALKALWQSMDKGGFDPALRTVIPQLAGENTQQRNKRLRVRHAVKMGP